MGDADPRSLSELDNEAVQKFNRLLKDSLDREKKLRRHFEWRGSKLPAFNIEHMQTERQRLQGQGMTAADRALRKQWLQDQVLSANEPRYIPDLYPKNPIRRILAAPWDALFNALKPVLGETRAIKARIVAPRLAMSMMVAWACFYHLKYNPSKWEAQKSWVIFESKPDLLPGDAGWPNIAHKEFTDFYDREFKERKVMLDCKTSAAK